MKKDNWAGRADTMICKTCIYYIPKGKEGVIGRCRMNPPTMRGFVPVFPTDWCGQHRLDERKV